MPLIQPMRLPVSAAAHLAMRNLPAPGRRIFPSSWSVRLLLRPSGDCHFGVPALAGVARVDISQGSLNDLAGVFARLVPAPRAECLQFRRDPPIAGTVAAPPAGARSGASSPSAASGRTRPRLLRHVDPRHLAGTLCHTGVCRHARPHPPGFINTRSLEKPNGRAAIAVSKPVLVPIT
jgi:hypothetical protein